jgi:hypothetical protein
MWPHYTNYGAKRAETWAKQPDSRVKTVRWQGRFLDIYFGLRNVAHLLPKRIQMITF